MSALNIEVEPRAGKALVATLSGALNAGNHQEASRQLEEALKDESITDVYFDLSGLRSITSAGLRVVMTVLKISKARKGTCYLVNMDEKMVYPVFKMTFLLPYFTLLDALPDFPE